MRSRFSDTSLRFWPICRWKSRRAGQGKAGPRQLQKAVPGAAAACPYMHQAPAFARHVLCSTRRTCTVEGAPTSLMSCTSCTVRVLAAAAWCRSRDSLRYSGSRATWRDKWGGRSEKSAVRS